jgi:hypothetical protein
MPFTNPTTTLPADAITPGTMTGVTVQTSETGRRVVLDPYPSAGDGTTSPSTFYFSGQASELKPGRVTSDVTLDGVFGYAQPLVELRAPMVNTDARAAGITVWGAQVDVAGDTVGPGIFLVESGQDVAGTGQTSSVYGTAGRLITSVTGAGGQQNETQMYSTETTVTRPTNFLSADGSSGWKPVSFLNGWTSLASWQAVEFKRLPDGHTMLRGMLKPPVGWAGAGQDVCTIPEAEARTFGPQVFPLTDEQHRGPSLFVYPDGRVAVINATGGSGWVSIGSAVWDTTA